MQHTDDFSIERSSNNGIERIVYSPRQRRFETPILMQHGIWHGAWCWQPWQELFARWSGYGHLRVGVASLGRALSGGVCRRSRGGAQPDDGEELPGNRKDDPQVA